MSENNEKETPSSDKSPSFSDVLENKKAKEVLLHEAIKQGTYAIEKYKKRTGIVEEGVLHLRIVLDVERADRFNNDAQQEQKPMPLMEVKVDDLFLGYINEGSATNEAFFKVECYKRGHGKWDKHTVSAVPVRADADYFTSGSKKARFAPTPGDSNEAVTVYIPIKVKRNWLGRKKKLPV